jgi:chromosome partitioning protein
MDFSSTAAFLAMLDETLEELASRGMEPMLNFMRIVASKADENKSIQKELMTLMRQVFGVSMIRAPLKNSAEIDNVTARLMTVYELDNPMTSKAVRDRCLTYLNAVNEEILVDIRSTWPSHAERLRKEGHA